MFSDASLTESLARILGLYMLAGGIGLLIDPKAYDGVMENFRANPALAYISAVVVFTIGAALVTLHNQWSSWPQIIVSLIGWAALVEGILMLAVRRSFFALVAKIPLGMGMLRGFGVLTLVLGALYLYAGFAA
ncbi:hypothetical protein [Hyphobacterium marinum]|uniref:DUF2065 domain-containing protein n=1 Tax=Hyphobacterium marinum TaxID=3116574 RepID=A0ABU7LXU9_9PROT|nr:hypothetical protein [Hyphobacterium sp. Y6023]MEE2566382.1 hypothetical protein [Hyphobacterium sp. Y6023]